MNICKQEEICGYCVNCNCTSGITVYVLSKNRIKYYETYRFFVGQQHFKNARTSDIVNSWYDDV